MTPEHPPRCEMNRTSVGGKRCRGRPKKTRHSTSKESHGARQSRQQKTVYVGHFLLTIVPHGTDGNSTKSVSANYIMAWNSSRLCQHWLLLYVSSCVNDLDRHGRFSTVLWIHRWYLTNNVIRKFLIQVAVDLCI